MNFLSFIIDTNVLIEIEEGNEDAISEIKRLNLNGDLYITSPTFSEFYFGLLRLPKQKLEIEKHRLDKYNILNTTTESSVILAELKKHTENTGNVIPTFDLFIASIAVSSGLPFITFDGHFKNIPNLKLIMLK